MAKKKKEELEIGDVRADELVLAEIPAVMSTSQGDFEIKPWSFGTYNKVGHLVENIIHDLEHRGLDPELLFTRTALINYILMVDMPMREGTDVDPDVIAELASAVNQEMSDLMKMFGACSNQARGLLMASLDIDEETVDNLTAEEALKLFVMIVGKNEGVLKNVYGLFETLN